MIKQQLGDRLDGWIHTAFPFLFVRPLNPDLLTVIGAIGSIAAAAALAAGWLVGGGILMLASGFFDLVDGVVARHFGSSTSFGAFLDSTLDRLVDMAVMLGLVIYYGEQRDWIPQLLASVVLMSSILTSYAKARAELTVDPLPGGLLERGERVGLLAAGSLFGWMLPVLWILALGTTLTACQRIASAHRQMELVDAIRKRSGEHA